MTVGGGQALIGNARFWMPRDIFTYRLHKYSRYPKRAVARQSLRCCWSRPEPGSGSPNLPEPS